MVNTTYAPILIDALISDVHSEDLHGKISKKLNTKYLSDSAQESDDVKGILFGEFQRLIGAMTLEIKGKIKNIHFLIDTGVPRTYICEEVLKSYKLFITDPEEPFPVRLNKRQISVKVSHDPFSDLNILGTDFLHTNRARLLVDFDEKYFTIKFKTSQTQGSIDNNELAPKRGGGWYRGRGYGRGRGHRPNANRRNSIMKTGEPSKTVVFVSNLPYSIDDDGLKDIFKDYNVTSAHVVRHRVGGRSKGFGFVELSDEEEQKKALKGLKNVESKGRVLVIKVALGDQ
jgi:hypothetical protein